MKASTKTEVKLPGFEEIKDRITARLVNREQNKEIMKSRPYKEAAEDLICLYQLEWHDSPEMMAEVVITNGLLEIWDVTAEDVIRAGEINTPRLHPPRIRTLSEALGVTQVVEPDIYVVSNAEGFFGAVAILYPGVQEELEKKLGDFYVIPSAVHEVLAVSVSMAEREELDDLIRTINASEVPPADVLSDHAYRLRDGMLVAERP
ncbi:MAG: hypothetical protein J5935_04070 [Lachnospiraceae bacterium]|nr:hypothetical protein [Lachnospiraceae bacterium]